MPTMQSPPITTAEQLLGYREAGRHELVRGEFRTMSPAGFRHGTVVSRLNKLVSSYADDHDLGPTTAAETGFLLARNPDTVRAPDLGFVRKDRLRKAPGRAFFDGPPDFAVEVVSASESVREAHDKARCWLDHGTSLVWVVDTEAETVTVHRPGAEPRVFGNGDVLDGGEVLPGFTLTVDDCWPR